MLVTRVSGYFLYVYFSMRINVFAFVYFLKMTKKYLCLLSVL